MHDHLYGRGFGLGVGSVGGVLLGGVLPPAVVQDAGNEKDEKEDNVAGYQDDEVEGHRVNLQVEFHEPHGDAAACPIVRRGRKNGPAAAQPGPERRVDEKWEGRSEPGARGLGRVRGAEESKRISGPETRGGRDGGKDEDRERWTVEVSHQWMWSHS